jgi:hypothetical protein
LHYPQLKLHIDGKTCAAQFSFRLSCLSNYYIHILDTAPSYQAIGKDRHSEYFKGNLIESEPLSFQCG